MPTFSNHQWPVLRAWTDQVEVTSGLPRPDEAWTFTDRAGHEHRWVDNAWPTLRRVVDEVYGCGDECHCEIESTHWECSECGEHVEPGMRGPSAFREYIPGMTHYEVDGVEVSPEEYQRAAAAQRAAVVRDRCPNCGDALYFDAAT